MSKIRIDDLKLDSKSSLNDVDFARITGGGNVLRADDLFLAGDVRANETQQAAGYAVWRDNFGATL